MRMHRFRAAAEVTHEDGTKTRLVIHGTRTDAHDRRDTLDGAADQIREFIHDQGSEIMDAPPEEIDVGRVTLIDDNDWWNAPRNLRF
jgi:hypothetical protein